MFAALVFARHELERACASSAVFGVPCSDFFALGSAGVAAFLLVGLEFVFFRSTVDVLVHSELVLSPIGALEGAWHLRGSLVKVPIKGAPTLTII